MALLKHRGQFGILEATRPARDRRRVAQAKLGNTSGQKFGRLWLCIFLTANLFAPETRGQLFKEYDVKARYLYHFAEFVEWPPAAFPTAESPVTIGILGTDPFGKTLDDLMQNEVAKNRKLVVKRYHRVEEVGACHILFISQSEERRLNEILSSLKEKSILTVGDTEGFVRQGGIIRFFTEKNKIRFQINTDAAKAAKLTISSKLLRIAELADAR